MTRARARWVADQVIQRLTAAGCTASPGMIQASVRLMVRQWQKEDPVRPEDVRWLSVVLKEARRLLDTLPSNGDGVAALVDVLDKAKSELEVLGTAAALAND